eukprot:scaffold244596_cov40-Attheya_sp.AAC.1
MQRTSDIQYGSVVTNLPATLLAGRCGFVPYYQPQQEHMECFPLTTIGMCFYEHTSRYPIPAFAMPSLYFGDSWRPSWRIVVYVWGGKVGVAKLSGSST